MQKRSIFSVAVCLTLGAYGQAGVPEQGGRIVSVPVLVELKSGELAYDLSATDFSLRDNGVEQQVDLESDPHARPLSLVLVIQTGHSAINELRRITHLDTLLDGVLTHSEDRTAIITFDSRPQVLQAFTGDSGEISNSLASIAGGNSSSALFDALHLAVNSFHEASVKSRRVIILISGEHDHGSSASDCASLIRDLCATDVSVYSLSFRAGRKELVGKFRSLNPLAMAAGSMQRNSAEALAQLTGGDFYRFDSERAFEGRFVEITNHIRNRYNLIFRPSDPAPGFHSLHVGGSELRNGLHLQDF